MRSSRRHGRLTGRSSRSCRCSIGGRRCYVTATTEQSFATPSRGPSSRTCASCCTPAPTRSASPAFLKQHDVPVILRASCRCRRARTSSTPIRTRPPGVLAKAGVTFAFSSGGFQFSRDVPFQAGRAVAWGLSQRRRDQGADAGCRAHARRRQPGRQHRGRQGGEPRRPHAAIRWRFDRRFST